MRNVIYSIGVSLDGYIAEPDGDFAWAAPDEELHRFHNQQTSELDAHLLGRKLYETMLPWEITDRDPSEAAVTAEFAQIWQALPKIVFSRTLKSVEGNARLAESDPAEEIARLKAQPGGDIGVGGAGLAAGLIERGLIDDYRLFVSPIVVGGGTPYFPPLHSPIDLDLIETRTFDSPVVYLRYRRRS